MNQMMSPQSRPRVPLQILDKRIGAEFPLPHYATEGAAGIDMRAMINDPITLAPGQTALVPSGIAMHLADPGLAAFLFPRSGLGHKQGLVLSNGTGVLDSDYTGQILIGLFNRGQEVITVSPGDRIAQMVIKPVVQIQFDIVETLDDTSRGAGGFGHTGKA